MISPVERRLLVAPARAASAGVEHNLLSRVVRTRREHLGELGPDEPLLLCGLVVGHAQPLERDASHVGSRDEVFDDVLRIAGHRAGSARSVGDQAAALPALAAIGPSIAFSSVPRRPPDGTAGIA